ncbi:hypothetical protein [Cryptosporangium sp. NPDC051539]|uniref:hypothetical protein n=1 Tax=Cryptosporangium sp. NPDC051539 TaxID=3363962 RepID=UPI0037AF12C3
MTTEDPPMWFTPASAADDRARAWLATDPPPVAVALLAGGPERAAGGVGLGGAGGAGVRAAVARSAEVRAAWGELRRAGLLTRRLRYRASHRGPGSTLVVLGTVALSSVLLGGLAVVVFDALAHRTASGALAAGTACLALLVGGTAALTMLTQWLSEVVPTTRSGVRDPRTPAGHRALELLSAREGHYRTALNDGGPLGAPTSWSSYRWRAGRGRVTLREPGDG